jgi:ABC-type sugar transport system substrate-binding protein
VRAWLARLMMMCLASVAAAQSASEGSGTAWLPQAYRCIWCTQQRGAWTLMTHENVFVQFVSESGAAAGDQVGSVTG